MSDLEEACKSQPKPPPMPEDRMCHWKRIQPETLQNPHYDQGIWPERPGFKFCPFCGKRMKVEDV